MRRITRYFFPWCFFLSSLTSVGLAAQLASTGERPRLVAGENLLALGVYQDAPGSSDLSLIVQLWADDQLLVDEGSEVRYIEPRSDIPSEKDPTGWTSVRFDDSSWKRGRLGLGYGDNDDNTVVGSQQAETLSIYARCRFRVDKPGQVYQIMLGADYDDAVVIWLNGTEIARSMPSALPAKPHWNSEGTEEHTHEASKQDPPAYEWMTLALKDLPEGAADLTKLGVSPPEQVAVRQLGRRVRGFVVWESNRTGNWELYRINTDGTGFRKLTDLASIYPHAEDAYLLSRISPDGKTILFGYSRRKAPTEIWAVSSEGGKPRKLTVGNRLNWSPDGRAFYLLRNYQVWQHDLATGKETLVHPMKLSTSGQSGSTVGYLRPDLKAVVVRSSKQNEYVVFDQGKVVKTMGGCEPGFSADGSHLYWVGGPKNFRVWNITTDKERQLLGTPPTQPWNYTYFPSVSADGRWLTYGASPNQHNHSTSDYEVYVQKLQDWRPVGKPVRLSWDPHTDRWPVLWTGGN